MSLNDSVNTDLIIRTALCGALAMWLTAILSYVFKRSRTGLLFMLTGWLCVVALLAFLWINLGRPPMRTMGETKLWFACFLPVIAAILHFKFPQRAVTILILFLACVMCVKDILSPEAFDQTMRPALRSPWFIPHVVVYMVSYSCLALSGLIALWNFVTAFFKNEEIEPSKGTILFNLVQIGFPLMTMGMLFGAFWAKEAWTNYWSWDPKETWALITWGAYAIYIHVYWRMQKSVKLQMFILVLATIALLITWFGVSMLPSAAQSIHTYSK